MTEYDDRPVFEDFEAEARTVLEHLQNDADEWDILGVDVAGEAEDGAVLFLLVIRRRVGDNGSLILSERYYRFDIDDAEGTWLDNGIERRVQGSLSTALKVLYAALDDGNLDKTDPMVVDSRDDGLGFNEQVTELNQSVRELRDHDDDAPEDTDEDALQQSVEGDDSPTEVECNVCGNTGPREDMVNLGTQLGFDMWVHPRCNDD